MALLQLNRGNLIECQKNILKIKLNLTAILHQLLLLFSHCLLPNMNFSELIKSD